MDGDRLSLDERVARQEAGAISLGVGDQLSGVDPRARAGDRQVHDLGGRRAEKADLGEIGSVERVRSWGDGERATGQRG